MRDRELYAKIVGISAPWQVADVVLDVSAGTVEVLSRARWTGELPEVRQILRGLRRPPPPLAAPR
jgi:hypothetical protein